MKTFTTIDVHGMTIEQAVPYVRKLIFEFYDRGENEIMIIHGKGEGILRSKIRGTLAYLPYIAKLRSGSEREGGTGVTIVVFKQ